MNSLQALAEKWPTTIRITTDGTRSLWRELNRFSGDDAAQRAFRQSHGDTHFEKRFRNAIRLADDYFLAYEDATETIDAVLLYYGSMWLCHAVNYVTHPRKIMEERSKQHGIRPTIEAGSKWPFLKAKVQVTERTATFNLVNMAFGGDDLSGKTFEVLDLLRAIPELDEHLLLATGSGTRAVRFTEIHDSLSEWYAQDGQITVQLHRENATDGFLRDNIAVYDYLAEHQLSLQSPQMSWNRNRPGADELNAVSIATGVARFLFPKVRGLRIAEASLYLAAVHALSELVRYYPDTWIDMTERFGDEIFVIRELMHVAEEKVPLLALNHLSKSDFIFRNR